MKWVGSWLMVAFVVVVWSSLRLVRQALAEELQRLHDFQLLSHYENLMHLDAPL